MSESIRLIDNISACRRTSGPDRQEIPAAKPAAYRPLLVRMQNPALIRRPRDGETDLTRRGSRLLAQPVTYETHSTEHRSLPHARTHALRTHVARAIATGRFAFVIDRRRRSREYFRGHWPITVDRLALVLRTR